MNVKSKIFFGTKTAISADEQFNTWIAENPDVKIIEFKYQHTTSNWHHSICILYKPDTTRRPNCVYQPHSGTVCHEEYFIDNFID